MLSALQKHYVVSPEDKHTAGRRKRFDRVVGLVPHSRCLYKTYTYQAAVVTREEVELCVKSELERESLWDDFEFYCFIKAVDNTWVACVWVWSGSEVTFDVEVTHVIPALAYEFGLTEHPKCVILHYENHSEWVAFIDGGVITKIVKVKKMLTEVMSQQVNSFSDIIYGDIHKSQLNISAPITSYERTIPRIAILNLGKLPVYHDIANPKTFYKPALAFIFFSFLVFIIDYSVISYKKDMINENLVSLQDETKDIQRIRAIDADMRKVISSVAKIKSEQQRLAKIMDNMLVSLPRDTMLNQFTYSSGVIVISGFSLDALKLADVISNFDNVKNARLIGEVVPQKESDKQSFKIEVEVE